MLGYRLYVDVSTAHGAADELALEQVRIWLTGKDLNPDALVAGKVSWLGHDTDGVLIVRDEPDGSRRTRVRTVEVIGRTSWSTQLTVEVPASRLLSPWLMVEVEGPHEVEPPGLARNLLEVMPGRRGLVTFGTQPQVVGVDGVDELLAAILDADRRTLLFVAGSNSELELTSWTNLVTELLRKTVGLASGYVLDPQATELLAQRLGQSHLVLPWTMRTFRPGVELNTPLDARRHRVLSTGTIVRDHVNAIATMLGRRASEVCLDAPLPARAKRIDRLFQTEINDLLVGMLNVPDAVEDEATAQVPGVHRLAASGGSDEVVRLAPPVREPVPILSALPKAIVDEARKIVGQIDDEELVLKRLLSLAQQGVTARESQERVARRLRKYEQDLQDGEELNRELRQQVIDSQLEQFIFWEELAASERSVRHLRTQLMQVGAGAAAWSEPEPELRPESFDDVLALLPELKHVTFTGDESIMLGLDRYESNAVWPGKVWDIVCTLEDYATCVLDGRHQGDVDSYLKEPVEGCRTYSGRHSRDETPLLKSTPKFANDRIFPVPVDVDPSGAIFMGAHFRVARLGTISPRLHYYNDVRGTGRVYVGYVGPHLRSPQTN